MFIKMEISFSLVWLFASFAVFGHIDKNLRLSLPWRIIVPFEVLRILTVWYIRIYVHTHTYTYTTFIYFSYTVCKLVFLFLYCLGIFPLRLYYLLRLISGLLKKILQYTTNELCFVKLFNLKFLLLNLNILSLYFCHWSY